MTNFVIGNSVTLVADHPASLQIHHFVATLHTIWHGVQINCINWSGSIGVCWIIVFIRLDISSKWNFAMFFAVQILACHDDMGLKYGETPPLAENTFNCLVDAMHKCFVKMFGISFIGK
jgi:hypothetical protein